MSTELCSLENRRRRYTSPAAVLWRMESSLQAQLDGARLRDEVCGVLPAGQRNGSSTGKSFWSSGVNVNTFSGL